MALLQLQGTLIYGPIVSRRLGRSLGVNILPLEFKLCSFNCVYCQYGWTRAHVLEGGAHRGALPGPSEVGLALHESLSHLARADRLPSYITFSGNGEPTLHPDFPEIVDIVLGVRDELAPEALVAILSNSTAVGSEVVRNALEKLDSRIMKLDCGDAETCSQYSRPCGGFDWEGMIEGLHKLSSFTLQALFTNLNSDDSAVEKWLAVVKELKPEKVQIYTLDRGAPLPELKPVAKERLRQIAELVRTKAGVPAEAY